MKTKYWVQILLVTILCVFVGSQFSVAQEVAIDFIRDIDFGTIVGAPGTYDTGKPGRIDLTANAEVNIEFYATPLAYAGQDYDFQQKPELDVVYRINPMPGGQLYLHPGHPRVVKIEPRGNGSHHFNFHGTITIHDIHLQPAGPYEGDIVVTISAGKGGG